MSERLVQLEKLLEAEPNDPFCLYSLAQEHQKAGDAARAIEFYDRTIQADPLYCYAYFHKAKVQEGEGDVEGAAATLREGLRRAQEQGDRHATAEIQVFLDEVE